MAGLGYAAGGLGQGLQQGRQLQFERQSRQRELGQRDTALSQEKQAEQNRVTIEQHTQNAQTWSALSAEEHDPNKYQTKLPAEIQGIHQKYMGFLQQHPEFDYGNEVAADNARNAQTQQAGNAEGADILSGGAGMNPSVSGQPLPSTPSTAPSGTPLDQGSAPATTPAPYPALPPTNGQPTFGPVPPAQQGASQAPPPPPVMTSAGQDTSGNPHPFGDAQTNSLNGDVAPVGIAGAPDAANNSFYRNAEYYDGQALDMTNHLTPVQRDNYRDVAAKYRVMGLEAAKTGASTSLLDAQSAGLKAGQPYLAPQAAATLGGTLQSTAESQARTATIGPESAARIGLLGEQTKEAGAHAKAIPQQVQQGQQALNLQASGQRIAAFSAHENAQEAQNALELECQKYGFSKKEFDITRQGMIASAHYTQAQAIKLLSDPSFNSQAILRTIQDKAYATLSTGQIINNGPTNTANGRYMEAVQRGYAPSLGNNDASMQYILTGQNPPWGNAGQPGGGQGANVNGLMADTRLTPQQKYTLLKRNGVTITPQMQKQLTGGK